MLYTKLNKLTSKPESQKNTKAKFEYEGVSMGIIAGG